MSTIKKTFTYDPVTQVLKSVEKPDPTITVTVTINLKTTTIQYNNDEPKPITDDDFFVVLEFMKNVKATPALMDALLNNSYYTKQFLKTTMGVFNTPIENNYLQLFPSFIFPYEALYRELVLKPKYAKKILEVYDKNNSAFIRKSKQLVRNILIVPGIFISPFIILTARLALNSWGNKNRIKKREFMNHALMKIRFINKIF
jgi:hypothetical protein